MSTGRVLWIIFCCIWAGFWLLSLMIGNVFALILVPMSLLSILIPVGKMRPGRFVPTDRGAHGR